MLNILGGPKASAAEGPLELLLGCHQRIREFTALAGRVASGEPASEADVADAARRVHRYHAVALPLHQADEEESIAPRLERGGAPVLLEALESMKRQHVELDAVIAGLLPQWELLAREPGRRGELSPAMAREIARLRMLWDSHLSLEEQSIFPELRGLPDLDRIIEEMRARRLASAA